MVKLRFPTKHIRVIGLALVLSSAGPGSVVAQAAYNAEATRLELTFERLMSSLGIKTRQIGTTGNQIGVTAMKSNEAQASAIATVGVRLRTVNGTNDYALGRDQNNTACSVTTMRSMARGADAKVDALMSAANQIEEDWVSSNRSAEEAMIELTNQRQNYYCPEEEFAAGLCGQLAGVNYNTGVGAGDTNASVFMDGNARGAEEIAVSMDFIDRVAPLPTIPERKDLETAVSRVIAVRESASISMARMLLAGSVFEGVE